MDASNVSPLKRGWAEKARDKACDLLQIPRVPIVWHYAHPAGGQGGFVEDDLDTAHRRIHLAVCDLMNKSITWNVVFHEVRHVYDLERGWFRGDRARMEREAEMFEWKAQYYLDEE